MPTTTRRPRGLASRIVRVMLIGGMITVVIAGIVAIVTVSNLASERAAARDLIALRLVEGAIEERLSAAATMLDRASALAAASRTETDIATSIAPLASGASSVFAEFAVVELEGASVLFSEPAGLSPRDARRIPAFLAATRGASGFSSATSEEGTPTLWATRTTVTDWGTPVVVLARLDSGFVARSLERAVRDREGRVAVLLDGGRLVASAGGSAGLGVESARWSPEAEGLGRVALRDALGRWYRGFYFDVQTAGDLAWRVVAAEPTEADLLATLRTVAAPLGVLVFGGLAAAVLLWTVTTRMVGPLRDLERTARSAAAGAYVKPLSVGGDDEIGQVADAFNQVALRLNALHDLSQLLASTSRLDQVLDGILMSMEHIVGQCSAAIYLVDEEHERLVPARTHGANVTGVTAIDMSDGGWLSQALDSAGPVTLKGAKEEFARELPGLAGSVTTILAAPLVAGHDPLGIVVVLRESSDEVSDAEREMVRTFSAQAAVAVQTSRLFEDESEARRIAEVLRGVAERLVRPDSLDTALISVEEIIKEFFGARMVHIALVDRGALGLPDDPSGDRDHLRSLALRVLEGSEDAVVLRQGADEEADRMLEAYDGRDLLVMPVGLETDHGAALLAVLPERPDAAGIEVARAVVDEIELALDNAYFYERALVRATNLETIFKISQAVASSLQVNVVLNRVLDVVQKILSADAVVLWSYDARRRTLGTAMVRGEVPARLVSLELEPGEDLPGRVFQSSQPVVIRDLASVADGIAESAADLSLHSMLAVPLLARGRPIGVLMVLSGQRDAFGDEEMNVLQTFASQAALAIDTARLYSREHEVARVLQDSILPDELPEYPELEVGSVYAPAGGEAEIGGDYFDLFRGPDGALWLAIADVCGKGIQAATKTSTIKYSLRALVAAGLSPAQVTGEINRITADAGDPSDIVTLWVGRYDPKRSCIEWANGGHPPTLVRRTDGTVERLGPTGPILGAAREAEYEECVAAFAFGDKLLLYTDGVTEARQGNTFFGEERLASLLTADGAACDDARLVVDSVTQFARGDLRDDVAVLVVTVRGRTDQEGLAQAG